MPALTAAQLTLRLIDRGLLASADGVVTEDVSRRNRNFTIVADDGAFFVKQNVDGAAVLRHEAGIYRKSAAEASPVVPHLPRLRYACGRFLVLDLIENARTLTELVSARGMRSGVACAVGSAVAKIHSGAGRRVPHAARPWGLELSAPPVEILRGASSANLELLRIVQGSRRFCRQLEALHREWRATTLIHADLRGENVLIAQRPGEPVANVMLVDWEHAGSGDPAWDVGSVFASLLFPWVLSLPFVPGMNVETLGRSGLPFERARRPVRAFWKGYAEGRALDGPSRDAFLLRAVQLAAVRLLEYTWGASQDSRALRGELVCSLQLSLNLLTAPRRAGAMLTGELA